MRPSSATVQQRRTGSTRSTTPRANQQQQQHRTDSPAAVLGNYSKSSSSSSSSRHHHVATHRNRSPARTADECEEEEDELAQLSAVDPRMAYADDYRQWGSHLVRLCADGATARRFPFLLDFEHAEPPPLFNQLVYYLPSERRHGVDKCLRKAGTIHLGCAELHDPRDEFATPQQTEAMVRQKKEQEEKERQQQQQRAAAAAAAVGDDDPSLKKTPEPTSDHKNNSNDDKSPPPMPSGGYMLHATLFLQLRILNHTYYLAPVDQTHREAVKRSIRRWIASARGPISAEQGNLLLRYAVTIPRPAVRKQLQKLVDRARKEGCASGAGAGGSSSNNSHASVRARSSSVMSPSSTASPQHSSPLSAANNNSSNNNNNDCNKKSPLSATELQEQQQEIAGSEEPTGMCTDGMASATFQFRDPFLCAVQPNTPARSTSGSGGGANNGVASDADTGTDDDLEASMRRNSKAAGGGGASGSTMGRKHQQAADDAAAAASSSPTTARVEQSTPIATVSQALVHGITMRDSTCD